MVITLFLDTIITLAFDNESFYGKHRQINYKNQCIKKGIV